MQGNDVHVTFDDDALPLLPDLGPRQVQPVEELRLPEGFGLRRVEVFGQRVVEDPACESDDAREAVPYREHEPVTEAVVAPAALVLGEQSGRHELLVGVPLVERVAQQAVPAFRGEADAELLDRRGADLARLQVLPRRRADGLIPKVGQEVLLRQPVDGYGIAALPVSRCRRSHFDTCTLAKVPQRLRERDALRTHHEVVNVTLGLAAEAVEEALVAVDVEGRGLLVVNRAQALQLAPSGRLESHLLADHLGDVKAGPYLLLGLTRQLSTPRDQKQSSPTAVFRSRRAPGGQGR